MFETKYREVFSQVTVSENLYGRVLYMKKSNKKSGRPLTRAVLAIAIIAMLAVTVSASEAVASWLWNYFALYSNGALTADQSMYIEENEQMVNQSQTVDGYTIEIKSAMTDGRVAYLVLGYSAPEGTPLTKNSLGGAELQIVEFVHDNFAVTDSLGRKEIKYTGSTVYYNDDGTNTQDIMLHFALDPKAENDTIDSEMEWNILLEGMTGRYYDRAYSQELEATKYAGLKSYRLTDEEAERMHPKIRLCEGTWEFSFRFEQADNREIELIGEPVTASACVGWDANDEGIYKDVTITSFKLGGLSATVTTDYPYGSPIFTNEEDGHIYVVMKDGSKVELRENSGSIGCMDLLANGPILLENVDHILLPDGTVIPMPE